MSDPKIEKFFCNSCGHPTKHFIRSEFERQDDLGGEFWMNHHILTIECCGCENLQMVQRTLFSEDVDYYYDETGVTQSEGHWKETIYPPVNYRDPPAWFEDLPDEVMRKISDEIYKSLQTGANYLATFGSRTLIDRLIVLTVGDQGSFSKGLKTLAEEGKISSHEREILNPVIEAGNAAAHRGWAPTDEQIKIILDTIEGLIHRLLVLPKLSEELDEAVPDRNGKVSKKQSPAKPIKTITIKDKIEAAPEAVRKIYDALSDKLKSMGSDVSLHPQKHYMAFRRARNFASVQIYNRKQIIRVYLNIDPENVEIDESFMRDVRQIGHYGTGNLEITLRTAEDIEKATPLIEQSYQAS